MFRWSEEVKSWWIKEQTWNHKNCENQKLIHIDEELFRLNTRNELNSSGDGKSRLQMS